MATFEWKQVEQIPVSHPTICSCTKSCRPQCFVVYPGASLPFQNFPRLPLWKRTHTHTHTFMFGHQQIKPKYMLQVFSAVCVFLQATAALVCDACGMHRHHEAIRSLAGKLHSLFNTLINSLSHPSSSLPPQASPHSHDLS